MLGHRASYYRSGFYPCFPYRLSWDYPAAAYDSLGTVANNI